LATWVFIAPQNTLLNYRKDKRRWISFYPAMNKEQFLGWPLSA
jgi:hypothetical protein